MCGRYNFSSYTTDEKLSALIRLLERRFPGVCKTGEIGPGDTAPAVICRQGKLVPVPAVFGFPGFRQGRLLINARSETAAEKPAFAGSLRQRRIILPASGFYEWGRDAAHTKYLFQLAEQRTVYLCGLYRQIGEELRFVILTRAANASMLATHDRMPVIAAEDEVRPYLTDADAAAALLAAPGPELQRQPA